MTDGQPGGEQVFLVPIEPDAFERTVVSPIDVTEHPDRPDDLQGAEEVRLWGVEDGGRGAETFDRIEARDLLLFYDGETYVGVGRAGLTFEDEGGWAASTVWDGAERSHLFTVTDFARVDVPRAAVNRLFDYGPDYSPGFMRVSPDRVTASVPAIELAVKRYHEERR